MRQLLCGLFAFYLAIAVFATVAQADPLSDAQAAYDRKDYASAHKLLRPLAEKGSVEAALLLGIMYYKGEGVTMNDAVAAKWFELANSQQPTPPLQSKIGAIYYKGNGVTPYYAEARRWYRQAAAQGYDAAQMALSLMYNGKGLPRNETKAYMWALLAFENGKNPEVKNLARDALNQLGPQLLSSKIQTAETMARRCRDSGYTDCDG